MVSTLDRPVRIIEPLGNTSIDIYKVSGPPDNRGNIPVATEAGKRLSVHKSRIVDVEAGENAPVVLKADGCQKTICITCRTVHNIRQRTTFACDCGYVFQFEGNIKMTSTETVAPPPSTDAVFELDQIRQAGELWTKAVSFDHKEYTALAHVLLVVQGTRLKKVCFNTYNGSLGKSSKGINLKELADPEHAGNVVTHTAEAERTKLQKKGYAQ